MQTPLGHLPEDSTPTLTTPHAGTRRGWDPRALTCLSSLSPATVAITYQLLVVFPSRSALGTVSCGHNTQLKLVPQTLVSQSPNVSPSRVPPLALTAPRWEAPTTHRASPMPVSCPFRGPCGPHTSPTFPPERAGPLARHPHPRCPHLPPALICWALPSMDCAVGDFFSCRIVQSLKTHHSWPNLFQHVLDAPHLKRLRYL